MDKDKFFEKAGFRTESFTHNGVTLQLRELSLGQRRAVLEAAQADAPTEVVSALTVAMSCPDFTEDDIETLADRVRPEVLVAAAQRVYILSAMEEGERKQAKKPLESPQRGSLFSSWRWPWGAQSES